MRAQSFAVPHSFPGPPDSPGLEQHALRRPRAGEADAGRSAPIGPDAAASVALGDARPRGCAGPGCDTPLVGRPRAVYCSTRCRGRAYALRTRALSPSPSAYRTRGGAASSPGEAYVPEPYIAEPAEPGEPWWCRRFRLLVERGRLDEASSLWQRVRAVRPGAVPSAAAREIAATLGLDLAVIGTARA
jgi:hypothetical protein